MDNKLRTMFEKDGAEMIETLDYLVSSLEERGFDQELLDQAFRTVHSFKSETSLLGYSPLMSTSS
ncbi:MAG TPA: Hpt domain-containing protein, partial [Spirochaetia bacterium]|nr:Hpt domain-containing protein [Spirochaetia bacterium]